MANPISTASIQDPTAPEGSHCTRDQFRRLSREMAIIFPQRSYRPWTDGNFGFPLPLPAPFCPEPRAISQGTLLQVTALISSFVLVISTC